MVKVTVEKLRLISRIINKVQLNKNNYNQDVKLAEYIKSFDIATNHINDKMVSIKTARHKSQEYLDNKYRKQYDDLKIQEIEVPELDISLLEGFDLAVGEICLLSELKSNMVMCTTPFIEKDIIGDIKNLKNVDWDKIESITVNTEAYKLLDKEMIKKVNNGY